MGTFPRKYSKVVFEMHSCAKEVNICEQEDMFPHSEVLGLGLGLGLGVNCLQMKIGVAFILVL